MAWYRPPGRHTVSDDPSITYSPLPTHSHSPMIGVFDSGIGGLSVLRHIRAELPHEPLLYLADQVHVPYGRRSAAEVRQFSEGISRFLLALGAKLVVVACNTASAAALAHLRTILPQVPFVGMEPAVKPAATQTRTGSVGVMATAGTFESARYAGLMHRFAANIRVYEDPCHGLVELIEAGKTADPQIQQLLQTILYPMLAAGVDTLVLGCTHYPLVRPLIEQVIANAPQKPQTAVAIIDPAPAVARQTRRVLEANHLQTSSSAPGSLRCFSTAQPEHLAALAGQFWGQPVMVETAVWQPGEPERLALVSGEKGVSQHGRAARPESAPASRAVRRR